MEDIDNKRHVWLSIGCPNKEDAHADFRIDKKTNKFYCNHCDRDFTKEFVEIYMALSEQLKK